jgi:endonuclease-3
MDSELSPRPQIKPLALTKRRLLVETAIQRWSELNSDPKCELYYETPYQLLVSVVLSAQTTDKIVNRCMEPLYKSGFVPATVLAWGPEKFLEKIRIIGLAPTKSRNVLALTKIITERFDGNIPRSREDLESLPGVGRKTANVILGEIYREPMLAVDTHVFRVGKRLGLHGESTAEKAEAVLLKAFDKQHLPAAHHWLILHGRYTCKAKKPLCSECLLADICPSLS